MIDFPPVSYNIPFKFLSDELRRCFFRELAVNGAKHIVLGSALFPQLMARPELPEMIASELAAAGLSFMDSHAPCGLHWDMGAPFEDEKRARVLRIKLAIELAAFFKVRSMTLHLGRKSPEMTAEQRLENICRTLDELLPAAEENNITLCIENSFAYFGFPQTLFDIKERFPVDTLGFCFDAGHANMTIAPESYPQAAPVQSKVILEAMLPHIVNCHIHDNNGKHDLHDLPGRGNGDLTALLTMLKKAPRLQVIQSEVNIPGSGVSVRELVETFDQLMMSCRETPVSGKL